MPIKNVKSTGGGAGLRAAAAAAAVLAFISSCDRPGDETTIAPRARWHNNQGVVYMDQHNYARASTEFKAAIALSPDYAIGLTNLGIAYFSLGQYDSAAVSLQTALRHDGGQLNAHYTLGLIYNAQGQEHEKALRGFEQVLQSDPDDPLLRYYLGQVKVKLDRGDEGMAEFREAIRLNPTHVSAHYALANQLRREGRKEEWQDVLARFNELSQAGHEGISASYQGQGKYAEVVADVGLADPAASDTAGPLKFSTSQHSRSQGPQPRFATLVDLDGDQSPELVSATDRPGVYRLKDGGFSAQPDESLSIDASGDWQDGNFGDWDNDGDQDLVLSGPTTTLLEQTAEGAWSPQPIDLGPAAESVFADVDHDGDLDLLLLGSGSVSLLSNDGQGQFEDITRKAGFAAAGPARQAMFTDFDNDRDIDVLLLGESSTRLYSNNRDGTFTDVAAAVGLDGVDAVDIAVEDLDRDSYMDVVSLGADGGLTTHHNGRGRQFEPTASNATPGRWSSLTTADLDNDGDRDLAVYGENGIGSLANSRGRFEPLEPVTTDGIAMLLVTDLNGDGALDLWSEKGEWLNDSNVGNWLAIDLTGLNSNLDAVGTKVEVKTSSQQQKLEVRGNSGSIRTLHYGLAREDSVEFIRVLWPGGVRQTELANSGNRTLTLVELDRKGTSCPILYVWDGKRFRFETDILGGGIIGYLVGEGQYYTPDTDEYVPLDAIAPRDGDYVLQIANQLEEIIYLDKVELVAVDHDPGLTVLPNERLLSAPPYPKFELYALANLRPLHGATDNDGNDLRPTLAHVDDVWFDHFAKTSIHGYVEEHQIVLDLGELEPKSRPVLVGHGWVDYAHSTSNWAASQAGLSLSPPRLEVPDAEGNWQVAMADMGTPAGLPKKMVLNLAGLFAGGDNRLRITTNAAVYWDQFQVGNQVESPLDVHRLGNTGADLHWRGYPRHTAIKGTFAFRYDYDDLERQADWGTHAGAYTRFGPVGELLESVDDRYVIMFHGDEVTVRFEAAALPPLPTGRERSFLLFADGFGKDMDLHSAHSLTVEPLPFHGMSSYPYPAGEHYPQDVAHTEYILNYNTRRIRGYYE